MKLIHLNFLSHQEANRRKSEGLEPWSFPEVAELHRQPITRDFLPGEQQIRVENLLETNQEAGLFRSGQRMWMTYDLLMGVNSPESNVHLNNGILDEIDAKLKLSLGSGQTKCVKQNPHRIVLK